MMLTKLNEILSLFTPERPELTALDVAERIGRPKSTVYRLLSSIADAGFLDYDDNTSRYRVGIRFAALGELAQRSTSLPRVVRPTLLRLSAEVRETATLMVRSGSEGITIDVVEWFHPVMLPGVLGGHLPLHASAGGKVLLCWLSPEQRLAAMKPPLQRFTASTTTDVDRLTRELDRVRECGYSTVRGEWVEDVFGVAAPVMNHFGQVVGAITVGAPRARANDEVLAVLSESVRRAAADASVANGLDVARTPGFARPAVPADGSNHG
ncbi:MAG: IclR family transcriptional regulator [Gemmatimonadaceae bacterium]